MTTTTRTTFTCSGIEYPAIFDPTGARLVVLGVAAGWELDELLSLAFASDAYTGSHVDHVDGFPGLAVALAVAPWAVEALERAQPDDLVGHPTRPHQAVSRYLVALHNARQRHTVEARS